MLRFVGREFRNLACTVIKKPVFHSSVLGSLSSVNASLWPTGPLLFITLCIITAVFQMSILKSGSLKPFRVSVNTNTCAYISRLYFNSN